MDNNDSPYRKDFGKVSEQAKRFWRETIEPIQARLRLEQASPTEDDMIMERLNKIAYDSYMSVWESRLRRAAEIMGLGAPVRPSNPVKAIAPKRSHLSDVSFPATGDFFPEELL